MKKTLYVAFLGACLSILGGYSWAQGITFSADPDVVWETANLALYNPLSSPRVAYLKDFRSGDDIVGGEVPVGRFYILEAVVGLGMTVGDSSRVGYAGGNLVLPNPLPDFASLDKLKPGLVGGYNLDKKDWILAFKAALPFGQ